jgi:hypothetical protein
MLSETPMTTRRTLLAATLIPVLAPTFAAAHVQPGARGPNGGPMADLGAYHSELVAKDGELILHVFDMSDQPIRLPQATATAVVLSEGRQQTVTFALGPDATSFLATGDFRAVPGMRVVVQFAPAPGQPRAQARFTPADPPR